LPNNDLDNFKNFADLFSFLCIYHGEQMLSAGMTVKQNKEKQQRLWTFWSMLKNFKTEL